MERQTNKREAVLARGSLVRLAVSLSAALLLGLGGCVPQHSRRAKLSHFAPPDRIKTGDQEPRASYFSEDLINRPPSFKQITAAAAERPPTSDELSQQLAVAGHRWFYGQGIGTTMLNVGTVVLFPPYALYLLGNAGVAFAGYEPLYVTDALPEPAKKEVLGLYNGVTGVPGRLNALVAGERFVNGAAASNGEALREVKP